MPILLANDDPDKEMAQLKAWAVSFAIAHQVDWFESDYWTICGVECRVVVKREPAKRSNRTPKPLIYVCRWQTRSSLPSRRVRGIGENALRYNLRRLHADMHRK